MPAYNELMAEQSAVLFALYPAATSAGPFALYPTSNGINVSMMNRIIIDVNVGSSITFGLTVKYCQWSNGTYSTGGISLPAAISGASSATPIGGAAGLFRFEFTEEFINNSIVGAATGQAQGSGTGQTGVWLQFTINTSATGFVSAVVYGQATYYPSSDNVINKFITTLTATGGAGSPVAQQFVDGVIGATPAAAVAATKLILPV